MSFPIGVVIPGRALQIPEQLTPDQWICALGRPSSVFDVLCFLTEPQILSPDSGVGVYFALPPFENWEFMGVLTALQPSILLSTGCKLETAASLTEKIETKPPLDAKKEFARRVALNLYRFVESFQGGSADRALLDRWFERFEARYKRDPNFVMKSE